MAAVLQQPAPAPAADADAQPALPIARSHPDVLALVAHLFGHRAPEPRKAAIVELGCADGGNLVPLAALLPEAKFLGMDARPSALQQAEAFAKRVGVRNIRWLARPIDQLPAGIGKFDYVICHEPLTNLRFGVQQLVLSTMKQLLAPKGVGYLSHGCRPGVAATASPEVSATQLLKDASSGDDITRRLNERSAGLLFTELAERLAHEGLQYLGDADFTTMFASNAGQAVDQVVRRVAHHGIVAVEQALDYLRGRQYRETLVCHAGIELARQVTPDRLKGLYLSAMTQETRSPTPGGAARYQAQSGAYITTASPALQHVMQMLGAKYPVRYTLRQMLSRMHSLTDRDRAVLTSSIFVGCISGAISLSLSPSPAGKSSATPTAWAVARDQGRRQPWVSNLQHQLVPLSRLPLHAAAIQALDGSCDANRLARELAADCARRGLVLEDGDAQVAKPSEQLKLLRRWAPRIIEDLSRLGLLQT